MPLTSQLPELEYLILRKEQATAWSEYDSGGTDIGIPLYEADYGVEQDNPIREQPIAVGDFNATFLEQDERKLEGQFRTPLYPATAKTLLDWAALRTSDELDSYSATHVAPSIETVRHYGLKVGTLGLAAAQRGDLVATLGLVGRYEAKLGSTPSVPTMPSVNGYIFVGGRFLVDLGSGSEIEPQSVQEFSLELANNPDMGPPQEDRTDSDKSMSISYLFAGKPKISGSITALWDRSAYGDMQRGRLPGSFRAVFAHKDGGADEVAAGVVAGSSASVQVADSSSFSVNEVVRFETSAGVLKCAGKISSIPDSTHIVITTLEKALDAGDLVYGKSLSIYVPTMLVAKATMTRTIGQRIRVQLPFQAFADIGAELLEYIAEGA